MNEPLLSRRWLLLLGMGFSLAWLALSIWAIDSQFGWSGFAYALPHEIGAVLAGVFAPLAFLWLLLGFLARGRDIAAHTALLRTELAALTVAPGAPNAAVEAASVTLRRDAEAVRVASAEAMSLLGGFGDTIAARGAELRAATEDARTTLLHLQTTLGGEIEAGRAIADRLEASRAGWQTALDRQGDLMKEAMAATVGALATERGRWVEGLAAERDRLHDATDGLIERFAADRAGLQSFLDGETQRLQTSLQEAADGTGEAMKAQAAALQSAVERTLVQGRGMIEELGAGERRFAEFAETAAARFERRLGTLTEELSLASEAAGQRGDRLLADLARHVEAMSASTDEASERLGRRLDTASEALAAALAALGDAMQARIGEARRETEAMVRSVGEAEDQRRLFERSLAEGEQRIEAANQAALSAANAAGDRLTALAAGSAEALERPFRDNLANFQQLSKEAAAGAEGVAEQLRRQSDALARTVAEVQAKTAGLGGALEGQMTEIVNAGRRFLADGAALGERLRSELTASFAALRKSGEATVGELDAALKLRTEELARQLAAAGREAAATATEQGVKIEAALKREAALVAQSAAEAQTLTERLAQTLRTEIEGMTSAGRRLMADGTAIGAGLARELEGFVGRLEKEGDRALAEIERGAAARGEALGQRLLEIGETIANDAEERGRGIEALLQRRAEAVQRVGIEAQSVSSGLGAGLQQQLELILGASRTLIAESEATSERLKAEFDRLTQRMTGSGDAALGAFDAATRERGEALHRHFQTLAETMADRAKQLGDRLQTATAGLDTGWRETAAEAERLKSGLGEELAKLRGLGTETATGLGGAVAAVEQRLTALAGESGGLVRRIETLLAEGARQTTALAAAAHAGETQIQAAGQLFAEQAARIAASASGAASVERQMQDGLARLDRKLVETASAGETRVVELERRVAALKGEFALAAEAAERQASTLAAEFRAEAEGLVEVASKAAFQTAAVRGAVKDQLAELGGLAQQITQLMTTARETLAQQAAGFAEVAAGTRTDSAAMREELAQQATALAGAADRVAERLAEIGAAVDGRAERLVEAADYASRRSGEVAAGFAEPTRLLRDTVDRVAGQVDGLAGLFAQQSTALVKASSLAEEQTVALRKTHESLAGDLFLKSATVMMEELNGIALDMQSLLDSDVPEDIWRDYHKGDRSIFARHLFRTRDSYMIPAIEQRYQEDDRFRALVSRYMDRFETLLGRAQEIDPENILNAAFITADVGKLYLVLSRSLARQTAS